jgi:hypothetical protein
VLDSVDKISRLVAACVDFIVKSDEAVAKDANTVAGADSFV